MTTRAARRLRTAYVALAAVDTVLAASRPRAHRLRRVTKPLLVPTLAASLVADPRSSTSPLRTTTLLAQAGGWGGDVALLGHGTKPFLAGVGSFALGHAAYLTGFVRHRRELPIRYATAPRVVAATWAVSAPTLAVLAARKEPAFGVPVLGYATMLAATTAAAQHLDPALPREARSLTAAGAATFMLSDTLLAVRKFVLEEPPSALEAAVMATYTAAQLLLSEGAVRAGVGRG